MKPPGTSTFLSLPSPIPTEPSIQGPYYGHEQTTKICTFYANNLFHRPSQPPPLASSDQIGVGLTTGGVD